MYDNINSVGITENHLKVLSVFTRGYDREYYIREVQRMLGISPRTAQLILEDLEKKAVLESKTKGKIRSYRIKKGIIARDYLLLAETYKTISFLERNMLVKEVVEKITPYIEGMAAIFGSYARGSQEKDSDVDIFIAGPYDRGKVGEVSELYGLEVNVKSCSFKTFEKNFKNDIFFKEIVENHIIISGIEDFVTAVVK